MNPDRDLEEQSEEPTDDQPLDGEQESVELTRSTYWAVQAMKTRGETRVVNEAALDDEDLEDDTAPVSRSAPLQAQPPPTRTSPFRVLLVAGLLLLFTVGCLGIGTVYLLLVQGAPQPAEAPAPAAAGPSEPTEPVPSPPPEAPVVAPPVGADVQPEPAYTPAAHSPAPVEPQHSGAAEPEEPSPVVASTEPAPLDPQLPAPAPSAAADAPAEPAAAEPFIHITAVRLSGPGSEAQAANVLAQAEAALLACYVASLEDQPTLATELNVSLRVLADGSVLGARARKGGRALPSLSPCVENQLLRLRFPGLTGAISVFTTLRFGLVTSAPQE